MKRIMGLNILPEMLALWVIETSVVSLAFYHLLHGLSYSTSNEPVPFHIDAFAIVDAVVLAFTVGLVGVATGLYRLNVVMETRLMVLQAAVSVALSLPAVWLVAKLAHINLSAIAQNWPLGVVIAWILLLLVTRFLYRAALRMNLFVRHVAVLGAPQKVARMIDAIGEMNRLLYRIEVVDPPRPDPRQDGSGLPLPRRLWGVVVAGQDPAIDIPVSARQFDLDTFWEDQLGRVDVASAAGGEEAAPAARSGGADVAAAGASEGSMLAAGVRRLLDIVLASLLLLLTAPLLFVTALLIRIESPGPVIYRQERVGLGGRVFTLWKFRSMRCDAERAGPAWAVLRDPRVTTVGRFIRMVRIDELPQLVNILVGDMSLVGPRPERPHFVEQLAREIPVYRQRSRVKPGLTGWAQVSFPYGASVEDARKKLSYDLYYVKHRSLLFDLMILISTVRVILFQEGAR